MNFDNFYLINSVKFVSIRYIRVLRGQQKNTVCLTRFAIKGLKGVLLILGQTLYLVYLLYIVPQHIVLSMAVGSSNFGHLLSHIFRIALKENISRPFCLWKSTKLLISLLPHYPTQYFTVKNGKNDNIDR